MADTKISGLTAITTVDDADIVCVVDTSDTSMGSGGSTRKATKANLLKVGSAIQAWDAELDTLAALTEARGSLIVGNATPAWSALAVGSANQILASDGTDAAWTAHPVEIGMAVSDESTNLTAGTGKLTFRMPHAMTLTGVRASVNTAPVGSTIIVDINEGGSTILSTKLSIDASEKTSTTAASAAVISDTALADDAEMTVDIDQIGSGTAGKGLKIWLIGTR